MFWMGPWQVHVQSQDNAIDMFKTLKSFHWNYGNLRRLKLRVPYIYDAPIAAHRSNQWWVMPRERQLSDRGDRWWVARHLRRFNFRLGGCRLVVSFSLSIWCRCRIIMTKYAIYHSIIDIVVSAISHQSTTQLLLLLSQLLPPFITIMS